MPNEEPVVDITAQIISKSNQRLAENQQAVFDFRQRQLQQPYQQQPAQQQQAQQPALDISVLPILQKMHDLLETYRGAAPGVYPDGLRQSAISEIEHLTSFRERLRSIPEETQQLISMVSQKLAPNNNQQ